MSRVAVRTCDACGAVAPPEHHPPILSIEGWFMIEYKGSIGGSDARSTDCLVLVAQTLRGDVGTDELEQIFKDS